MTDDSYRLIDTRLYKEDDIILILVINHINKFIYVSIEFMFHQIIIKVTTYYKMFYFYFYSEYLLGFLRISHQSFFWGAPIRMFVPFFYHG